jgi:hypothetical protein
MPRKVILFELNEVPWQIMDEFCQRRPDSTLARVLLSSAQYETVTADEGKLQPWKTWPSVHRGVADTHHKLAHLGQSRATADATYPPVWELLTLAGVPSAVFGSLHSDPLPPNFEDYAFYMPDTFASDPTSHPAKLTSVQAFNLMMTRESGRNVSRNIHWGAALGLALRAPWLGIRLRTFLDIAMQLVDERLHDWRKVRRRTYQSVLLFDVFMRQLEQTQPSFATFFTNHVASAMHRFWAGLFPEDYAELDLGQEWFDRFAGEVPFAMEKFDGFLSRLVAFVDRNPRYQLVVASSMGQGPIETAAVSRKLYLKDPAGFASALGLAPDDYEQRPAMEPTINFQLRRDRIDFFRTQLESLSIAGEPAYFVERDAGFFNMVFGQSDVDDAAPILQLGERSLTPRELGLRSEIVEDGSEGTAYHIPYGVLFIYDPLKPALEHSERPRVSALEFAPALLRSFGIAPPNYMQSGGALPELSG